MPANKPSEADALIAPLVSVLGISVKGDLGPYTIYTNRRGKIVFYPRAPPKAPPTQRQKRQRLRFKLAQRLWHNESAATQATWETLTRKAAICMTGQNLYISLALNPQPDNLANVAASVGLTVTAPQVIDP